MSLKLFATTNFDFGHENSQFEEILRILRKEYEFSTHEYCYCFINIPITGKHYNRRKQVFESLHSQIDVLIVKKNLCMILDIKDKCGEVIGITEYKTPWKIRYKDSNSFRKEKNYYELISRQRTVFIDNQIEKLRDERNITDKIRVDARVVFRDGSHLKIESAPTKRIKVETFDGEILPNEILTEDERSLLRKSYQRGRGGGIDDYFLNREITQTHKDYNEVKRILEKIGYNRADKWFGVITMSDFKKEIAIENQGFCLSENDISCLAQMMELEQRNIDEWYAHLETPTERVENTAKIISMRLQANKILETALNNIKSSNNSEAFSALQNMQTELQNCIKEANFDNFDVQNYRELLSDFEYIDEYDQVVESLYAELIIQIIQEYTKRIITNFNSIRELKEKNQFSINTLSLELYNLNNKCLDILNRYSSDMDKYAFRKEQPCSEESWNKLRTADLLSAIEFYQKLTDEEKLEEVNEEYDYWGFFRQQQ